MPAGICTLLEASIERTVPPWGAVARQVGLAAEAKPCTGLCHGLATGCPEVLRYASAQSANR
jgi:hypothetical protein